MTIIKGGAVNRGTENGSGPDRDDYGIIHVKFVVSSYIYKLKPSASVVSFRRSYEHLRRIRGRDRVTW